MVKISFVAPRIELRPYIRSIWVFESSVGLPASDNSLAAPNGCAKLIFNCENSLFTTAMGHDNNSEEQSLYFIGVRSVPVSLSSPRKKTSFIGIEFHPSGAHPILQIPMVELADRRVPADDLSGTWSRSLTEMLRNHEGIREKVDFIQERLLQRLNGGFQNPLVAFCVEYLRRTDGSATVSDLQRETGYEKRHLEKLFRKDVGVSPKTLAGIFRFQRFYQKLVRVNSFDSLKEDVHRYYYDDAHFNKDFKRMTGFPPKYYFLKVPNRFGRQLSLE